MTLRGATDSQLHGRRRLWTTTAGRDVDVIHIVGGGSCNDLLCQLTADLSGRRVVAGPVEATAIGNVLVQARTHGAAPSSLVEMRAMLATSVRDELRELAPGAGDTS